MKEYQIEGNIKSNVISAAQSSRIVQNRSFNKSERYNHPKFNQRVSLYIDQPNKYPSNKSLTNNKKWNSLISNKVKGTYIKNQKFEYDFSFLKCNSKFEQFVSKVRKFIIEKPSKYIFQKFSQRNNNASNNQ